MVFLPKNKGFSTKGVNPGGDGGDISPPCFDMGGITCLLSPPCFDLQICWVFLFWKINNVLYCMLLSD